MPLKPIVVAAPTISAWVAMLAAATLEGIPATLERSAGEATAGGSRCP